MFTSHRLLTDRPLGLAVKAVVIVLVVAALGVAGLFFAVVL